MNRNAQRLIKCRPASTKIALTIRLPEDIAEKIGSDLEHQESPISRNNWLLEAVVEKLHRDATEESSNGTK